MSDTRHILGISAFFHDSAAALINSNRIVTACQEERFSRKKGDWRFPVNAIAACTERLPRGQKVDAVAFFENPLTKMLRIYQNVVSEAPNGAPLWRATLQSLQMLDQELPAQLGGVIADPRQIYFTPHHRSHAASAFYPSPFREAAVLVVDGVGEYSTTTIWRGSDAGLEPLREIRFPHSLGLLYSGFTQYCGFKVNTGEYKLMGLAPFGKPTFKQQILDELIDLKPDGSFALNLKYFGFHRSQSSITPLFEKLLGQPIRLSGEPITQHYMNVAASVQSVLEDAMVCMADSARAITGSDNLCLAGGVALNCVANSKIVNERIDADSIWIQPAAGDAGGALGAALDLSNRLTSRRSLRIKSRVTAGQDSMSGAFLGPSYSDEEIEESLTQAGLNYDRFEDGDTLVSETAKALANGLVIGHFDGKMEFGPRALGNRSILADPRPGGTLERVNLKIKFRESWRPFAPIVLEKHAARYFDGPSQSPYMLLVAQIKEVFQGDQSLEIARADGEWSAVDLQRRVKSEFNAVTHVDFSSRLQTIAATSPCRAFPILEAFFDQTGCPMLLNTSFNVRGEPIVCSPDDAVACFLNTDLDMLVIGSFMVSKDRQSANVRSKVGRIKFDAD